MSSPIDEERRPDGPDGVRCQWEQMRIARERAENERRQREAFGTCTTSTSLADVTCATCVRMDALVCATRLFRPGRPLSPRLADVARVRASLGVEVALGDVFGNPTVAGVAELMRAPDPRRMTPSSPCAARAVPAAPACLPQCPTPRGGYPTPEGARERYSSLTPTRARSVE